MNIPCLFISFCPWFSPIVIFYFFFVFLQLIYAVPLYYHNLFSLISLHVICVLIGLRGWIKLRLLIHSVFLTYVVDNTKGKKRKLLIHEIIPSHLKSLLLSMPMPSSQPITSSVGSESSLMHINTPPPPPTFLVWVLSM